MTRRHVRRRYRRNPAEAPLASRQTARRPASPSLELDAERFEELVQARARELFDGPLEEVARDPVLRQVVHDAIANGLRRPPRPIPPEVLELTARLNASGLRVSPGTCDLRDLPTPLDVDCSLSDAILEERYGGDY
jgi:hypothetical protein